MQRGIDVAVSWDAPKVFSTTGLSGRQQIESWQAHNSAALMALKCRLLGRQAFGATTVNVSTSSFEVARVSATNAHVIERTPQLARRRPEDSIVMFFALGGTAFAYHADGAEAIRAGQMLVLDADRPFIRGFSDNYDEVYLKIPRSVFLRECGAETLAHPRVIAFGKRQDPRARSLALELVRAARLAEAQPIDEGRVLRLLSGLMRGPTGRHVTGYFTVAERFIARHLEDVSLSASTVASAVGISVRHLSRVFAAAGTTVPQYILERRLEAARALILKPGDIVLSVADVAKSTGFVSASYFSTRFSEHFGVTPSDLRRRSQDARRAPTD